MSFHRGFKYFLYGTTLVLLSTSVVMGMEAYSIYQQMENPVQIYLPNQSNHLLDKTINRKREKVDYDIIIRRNLFASFATKGAPTQVRKPLPKKKTVTDSGALKPKRQPLNLRLVGTTVGPQGIRFAIFEDLNQKTHLIFRKGERIQGAMIQSVERGEVYLLRDGSVQAFRIFHEDISRVQNKQVSPITKKRLLRHPNHLSRRNHVPPFRKKRFR